jgi:hypothetical protein
MKADVAKRMDKARQQDLKYREMPDIVVKVVCRYRAELFFKISRKTKLSRLFDAWTDRMETTLVTPAAGTGAVSDKKTARIHKTDGATTMSSTSPSSTVQFIFTHGGRTLDAEQTPEEAGIEDGDEILAVELMDLTEGPGTETFVREASDFRNIPSD